MDAVLAREIMKESQSNLEGKVNPSILNNHFSSRIHTPIFTSIEPLLLDRSKETSWVFAAMKSTSQSKFYKCKQLFWKLFSGAQQETNSLGENDFKKASAQIFNLLKNYFRLMFHFYTPWKYHKNQTWPYVICKFWGENN